MKITIPFATLLLLLFTITIISSTSAAGDPTTTTTNKPKKPNPPQFGLDQGGFFGPGTGFDIPGYGGGSNNGGWGNIGGGYGAGYGGPSGGYTRGGIIPPSMVCSEKGPCYKMKLTCPTKCFTSYSRAGRNYGGGGGGGGCTMDCKKKCVAYC